MSRLAELLLNEDFGMELFTPLWESWLRLKRITYSYKRYCWWTLAFAYEGVLGEVWSGKTLPKLKGLQMTVLEKWEPFTHLFLTCQFLYICYTPKHLNAGCAHAFVITLMCDFWNNCYRLKFWFSNYKSVKHVNLPYILLSSWNMPVFLLITQILDA